MKGNSNPTIRTTAEGEQVGFKMHAAVQAAERKAWASKNELAKHVGPHGSQDYGYRIVDRCIRKNLIAVDPSHDDATPQGMGAVVLTDKGARYLNETEDKDLEPSNHVDADEPRWERK